MPYGLRQETIESMIGLAEKHHLDQVILFGSRARGNYRPRSDIDIAVSGGNIPRFRNDIEEETPTLLMFDVVDIGQGVQPELLREIEREGIILYEKA